MLKLMLKDDRWCIDGMLFGTRVRRKLPFTKDQKALAEKILLQEINDIAEKGRGYNKDHTFRYLLSMYCVSKSNNNIARYLSEFIDSFGDKHVNDITPELVMEFLYRREKRPTSVRNELMRIKAIMNFGHYEMNIVKKPLLLKIGVPASTQRVRFVNKDERDMIIEKMYSYTQECGDITKFLFYTGARINEALSLVWDNVKDDFVILKTKKGRDKETLRRVPLLEGVIDQTKRGADTDLVFPEHKGHMYYAFRYQFRKGLKALGIKDFRIHDCRHTYASHLLQDGLSLKQVSTLLGHKSIVMTERYAHLVTEEIPVESLERS